MKKLVGKFLGLIIVTLVALAVAITVTAGSWKRSRANNDVKPNRPIPKTPVSVGEIRLETIPITDTYSGMIRPWRRYSLGFEIAGRVGALLLDEGQQVTAGKVLAQLDDRTFRAQLQEATAQLEEAKARIAVANARLIKARADMARSVELIKRGSGAISEAEYQNDKAQLAVAEAQLAEAKAQQARADALVATAEKNLNDATLRSPVDGVVSKRPVELGESVNPHQAIMEIIQIDEVLLVVGVPEAYVGDIRVGQAVEVELLARDRFRRKRPCGVGRVYRVAEAADQTTGVFEVEIVLPNPQRCWKPGLIALAHIVLKEIQGFRIPAASIVFRDDQAYLFSVDQEGKARRFDLKDWIEQGSDLIVTDLPADRRTVVKRGQHRLVDGRDVRIVPFGDDGRVDLDAAPRVRSPASVAESRRPSGTRE